MKICHLILAPFLSIGLVGTIAIGVTLANKTPGVVDAEACNITVYTEKGGSVSVTGDSYTSPELTDGKNGDALDGQIQLEVPLVQNSFNEFEVTTKVGEKIDKEIPILVKEESAQTSTAPVSLKPTPEGTSKTPAKKVDPIRREDDKTVSLKAEPLLNSSGTSFFKDIEDHWAKDYIGQLYFMKVVSGRQEGRFEPDSFMTRAELTKMALLAFGHQPSLEAAEPPFPDVPVTEWFTPYIVEAKRLGIIIGYMRGNFGPHDFITRAATLKILLGAAGIDPAGNSPTFPDVPTGFWFTEYIGFAQKNGLVDGYENGWFGPADSITRAQVAKVIVRLLGFKAGQP